MDPIERMVARTHQQLRVAQLLKPPTAYLSGKNLYAFVIEWYARTGRVDCRPISGVGNELFAIFAQPNLAQHDSHAVVHESVMTHVQIIRLRFPLDDEQIEHAEPLPREVGQIEGLALASAS